MALFPDIDFNKMAVEVIENYVNENEQHFHQNFLPQNYNIEAIKPSLSRIFTCNSIASLIVTELKSIFL